MRPGGELLMTLIRPTVRDDVNSDYHYDYDKPMCFACVLCVAPYSCILVLWYQCTVHDLEIRPI